MPVNLTPTLELLPIDGIRLCSVTANIRYVDRDDLVVIECSEGSVCGGVFTQNTFRAPPVELAEAHTGEVRGLVINSGNANAATGQRGLDDASACCDFLAELVGCETTSVLPFSTGVIGEFLPMNRMKNGIQAAFADLDSKGWNAAANAILTTDTEAKGLSTQFEVGGETITATGIVKGSGMMRPDMATMLAFLGTDACMSTEVVDQLTRDLADVSFNCMTIDGDTSTNDSFVVLATGASGSERVEDTRSNSYKELVDGLTPVVVELAHRTIRDAEGATKFITIKVNGGVTEAECRDVAYTVAHSPLVKTAAFASDPNWGRICMSVGNAGLVDFDQSRFSLHIDDLCVVRNGIVAQEYEEETVASRMAQSEFTVSIELNRGQAAAEIWTSDLSYDYVKINAEYRT